ncbi:hypothetical protein X736_07640 [Mesorhizobium sp. L2C089B000]|nr:hypothetical protein X761_15800 [Mesorhizobium sp. LSHC424B00]ESZ08260.1 hypothetical protein X736_07640 [Mesorhizobium sp. L2C089B000]
MADQCQQQRARQPLADHCGDRLVVIEAVAEIAAGDDAGDPVQVLDGQRFIEAVLDPIGLRLRVGFGKRRPALVDELRTDIVGIVARRRLDDGKGDQAQDDHDRHRRCYAHGQESQHRTVSPPWI